MPPSSGPSPGQLKVMISSTSLDLPAHRKAAMDAVLRAGCFPLAMEHGTATSNSDAIRFSLDMVDQADLYVGIFAQRYGFIPDNKKENPQGWSVTEHEYRRAKEQGIPRLIYLADKDHKFSEDDFDFEPEKRAKLKTLKEELAAEICGFFSTPAELHSLILRSLFEEMKKRRQAETEAVRRLRVFLCHSSEDKPVVRKIYQRLRSKGFEPWLDEEKLLGGQDWQLEISAAVREADVVVICLSRDSVSKAGFVQKEIRHALDIADIADEQPERSIFM